MKKERLLAFTDGVLAIVITIMVLELRPPAGASLTSLLEETPRFLSYLLSFVFLAIYWNNHHNLFQSVKRINGGVLWANLHLLFWLSLVPFATAWLGERGIQRYPVAFYGLVLILAAAGYFLLVRALIRVHGPDSDFVRAIGSDFKGKVSMGLYALGLLAAFISPVSAILFYVLVAGIWFVPDRRFEAGSA